MLVRATLSPLRFTDRSIRLISISKVRRSIFTSLARLRTTLAKPYHVPGRTGYVNIPLDVSIGLAEYQREDDVHSILERADSELCRQRGRVEQQKTA